MTPDLQIQPYTYYNPESGKPPLWVIALGGLAAVGIGYLVLRPGKASAAVDSGSGSGSGDSSEGMPPGPSTPPTTPTEPPSGPGGVAPGPGTLPPPPTDPEPPGDLAPPELPPAPVNVSITTGLDVADYPWGTDGTLYIHPTTPTPSMVYVVKAGNTFEWLVRNAVGSALVLAGRPELVANMKPNNAAEYAEPWAKRLRKQMGDALVCSWWNDSLYGQTDPGKAGGAAAMGPNGRGLNWTPVHRNNIGLLMNAEPPERSTTLVGNRDAQFTAAQAGDQMDLWIPATNLDALKTLPKDQLNLVFDLEWANGLRAINPPPQVSDALGINYALFVGGCPGWTQG